MRALHLIESELLRLKWQLAAMRFERALRRHALALKVYNREQPRDDRGRWTDTGGGSGISASAGSPKVRRADAGLTDPRIMSDAVPHNTWIPGAQYAQNERSTGYPVDLQEERRLGGHAIERHVGKSPEFLLNSVRREALEAGKTGFADGLRVGSFPSLEAANKLVNATLAQNRAEVALVASGGLPKAQLDAYFGSVTGYEAYAPTERSQPYMRDTYGVHVVIVRDRTAPKGYRVDTAFPKNFGR